VMYRVVVSASKVWFEEEVLRVCALAQGKVFENNRKKTLPIIICQLQLVEFYIL